MKRKKLDHGFTLIEFLVASAVMMIIVMGMFTLISTELLNLQITRQRVLLGNAANSELQRLLSISADDPDLSTDVPHSKDTTTENKIPISLNWTVTAEEADDVPDNDRLGILRIEMKARMRNRPVNNRVYVGRKLYYK